MDGYRYDNDHDKPPNLLPLYPIGGLFPDSKCPHKGPIPKGSKLYCEVCGQSGLDGLTRHTPLRGDPAILPGYDARTAQPTARKNHRNK